MMTKGAVHRLEPSETIAQLLDDADAAERRMLESPSSSLIRRESQLSGPDSCNSRRINGGGAGTGAGAEGGADAAGRVAGDDFGEVFDELLEEHERAADANAASEARAIGAGPHGAHRSQARPAPLPPAPPLATGPGDLVLVFGLRDDALTVAQSLAVAHPGIELGVAGTIGRPGSRHVGGRREATQARADGVRRGSGTLVAVGVGEAPGDAEQYASILAEVVPDQVWIAVDVTRKPEDTRLWAAAVAEAGGGIDAVAAIGTAYTATPGSTALLGIPVGWSDGALA